MTTKLTAKQREFLSALVNADLVSDSHFGAATKTWALDSGYAIRRVERRANKWRLSGYEQVTTYSITDAGRAVLKDGAK